MSDSHYEFGQFRLFPAERLLLRGTEAVHLAPRAFDTLLLLVKHRGRILEKEALMLYFAGQYDSAIEQLRETIELDPNFALGHWSLGRVYRQQGRYEEAMIALRKAMDLSGGSPMMMAALGRTYAMSGQRDEAHRILEELRRMSRQRYVSPYDIAAIYSGLREKDRAFEWLDRACEEHSGRLFYFNVDPYWDWLRSDPRFVAVLRRLGLAQEFYKKESLVT